MRAGLAPGQVRRGVAVLDGHAGGVTGVQFHTNGTQALTGGADKTAKLWDVPGGKVVPKQETIPPPPPSANITTTK